MKLVVKPVGGWWVAGRCRSGQFLHLFAREVVVEVKVKEPGVASTVDVASAVGGVGYG